MSDATFELWKRLLASNLQNPIDRQIQLESVLSGYGSQSSKSLCQRLSGRGDQCQSALFLAQHVVNLNGIQTAILSWYADSALQIDWGWAARSAGLPIKVQSLGDWLLISRSICPITADGELGWLIEFVQLPISVQNRKFQINNFHEGSFDDAIVRSVSGNFSARDSVLSLNLRQCTVKCTSECRLMNGIFQNIFFVQFNRMSHPGWRLFTVSSIDRNSIKLVNSMGFFTVPYVFWTISSNLTI